jgi:hypothetical protein
MYTDLGPLNFNVFLGWEAHQLAQRLQGQYSHPDEAGQAYRYTLIRSAGELYLRSKGFKVKKESFDDWNPKTQHIVDIACLEVEGIGRVQLIPTMPEMERVKIPIEARNDRSATVGVELDTELEELEELSEATLVGFTREINEQLILNNLEALDNLPSYLKSKLAPLPTKDWFLALIDHLAETGWQFQQIISESISNIPNSAVSGSSSISLAGAGLAGGGLAGSESLEDNEREGNRIIRLGETSVQFVMELKRINDEQVGILVKLKPSETDSELPPHLELKLIDEEGIVWKHYLAREQPKLIKIKRYFMQRDSHCILQIILGEIVEEITITASQKAQKQSLIYTT